LYGACVVVARNYTKTQNIVSTSAGARQLFVHTKRERVSVGTRYVWRSIRVKYKKTSSVFERLHTKRAAEREYVQSHQQWYSLLAESVCT